MEIKKAMEIYFDKQRDFWQSKFGTLPKVPYNNENQINNPTIIPDSVDEEDYVEWQPITQEVENIDFSELEARTGIKINPKIKQYYNSYWFLSLVGEIDNTILDFSTIPYGIDIVGLAERCYLSGIEKFPDGRAHFGLGYAYVDGDDSYLIYVENETTIVKCLQVEDNIVIEMGALEDVISKMDVGM